jgi:UDP-N-acetylglucosamine 2-epimerase
MSGSKEWVLEDLRGVGLTIYPRDEYGIIMFHPDTLDPNSSEDWVRTIIEVIDNSKKKWFWFWPNPDFGTGVISKRLRQAREKNSLSNVHFVINTSPDTFVKLAIGASMMIGNSSFGIRESSFIGLPVVNLGFRQNNRQRATNVVDILEPSRKELERVIDKNFGQRFTKSEMYGNGKAGITAAQIIASWTPRTKGVNKI